MPPQTMPATPTNLEKEWQTDFQSCQIILFEMFYFKQKWHGQKQESIAHKQENQQPIDTIPEQAQVLAFLDKHFKVAIVNIF